MSQVVDHLAELTGFRDRDVLDTTLVGVLRDLLHPISVAICHCVGEEPNQRWLIRARLNQSDVAAQADPMWVDLEALPALDTFPGRLQCLRQQEPLYFLELTTCQSENSFHNRDTSQAPVAALCQTVSLICPALSPYRHCHNPALTCPAYNLGQMDALVSA